MSGKGSLEVSRLIAEVYRRPELWDRQHPQHHNRSVLDLHWDSVAALLGITGKAARGKWKNLKDHFRKEYKRCMTSIESDQEMSRWPYFYSMMFIKDQISHTVKNSAYLSDLQYQNIYPEVELKEEESDEENPLNCLNLEYDNQNSIEVKSEYSNQDENISDDKHFLLSLLPMLSTLPMDKKLVARIAIETSLLNIAYPDLNTEENVHSEQTDTIQTSPKKTEKRKKMTEDERRPKKRLVNSKKIC
ncbi:Transcription factor Adf-1 [Aphis craccivora]|uniref:Transcription factor Adf-1 n=1 Tax=Aphis craccivora TaxID=307492 RepID=A0A6G0ZPB3_APHCR|nr:Transcription factor Adf-1 [Aphis craccivora]